VTIVLCEQQSIVFIRKKVTSLSSLKSGTKGMTSSDNLNIILLKTKEFILKKSGTNMIPNLFTKGLTNKPISEKEKNVKGFLTR